MLAFSIRFHYIKNAILPVEIFLVCKKSYLVFILCKLYRADLLTLLSFYDKLYHIVFSRLDEIFFVKKNLRTKIVYAVCIILI